MKAIAGTFPIKCEATRKSNVKKVKFIGAFAPYGYCKDPENKNCLVIDSYAADIVRKIFSWKIMDSVLEQSQKN